MNRSENYQIVYDPKALKELQRLDKPVLRRIVKAIDGLALDPRPPGCRTLVGHSGLWRIRVGDHRVIYAIKDEQLVVLVLRAAHRSDVYRRL